MNTERDLGLMLSHVHYAGNSIGDISVEEDQFDECYPESA